MKQGLLAAAFSAIAAPGVIQLAELIGLTEIYATAVTAGVGNILSQISIKGDLDPAEAAEATALAFLPASVTQIARWLGFGVVGSEAAGAYIGVGESIFAYGLEEAIQPNYCPDPQ